jgi:hypothetical protein
MKKNSLRNGLMGIAIASSMTSTLMREPQNIKQDVTPSNKELQISVEGKWAAGLAIYGAYASDSSASKASTIMGGFAVLAGCIPGGQFAAGYYGL